MRCRVTDCTLGCTLGEGLQKRHSLLIGRKAHTMSNKFLGFLATMGKDVVHVVEAAPKAAVTMGKLLADASRTRFSPSDVAAPPTARATCSPASMRLTIWVLTATPLWTLSQGRE
jgi:hypothetical protein